MRNLPTNFLRSTTTAVISLCVCVMCRYFSTDGIICTTAAHQPPRSDGMFLDSRLSVAALLLDRRVDTQAGALYIT